eukprot:1857163-Amphidinium_carterae.1
MCTSPPKKLTKESVAVLPYIDNLTVIGLDKTLVQKAKEVAVTRLRRFFVVHEEVNAIPLVLTFWVITWTENGAWWKSSRRNVFYWNKLFTIFPLVLGSPVGN